MTAPDHLQVWLRVRDAVPWRATGGCGAAEQHPIVPIRDGAVHDILTYDRARDPRRAERLLTALSVVRADAASDARLTFQMLSTWQRHVLGVSQAPIRCRPAYAKQGRERYGAGPEVLRRFDSCLAQSHDPALPLSARAARLYLDVCFFHPFDDGNARSAFLALTFVLARAGITLDQVGPIRRLTRDADAGQDAVALADLIAVLIANTDRRVNPRPEKRLLGTD